VEHLKGALFGLAQALLENIRLGWKAWQWTKTLHYFEHL